MVDTEVTRTQVLVDDDLTVLPRLLTHMQAATYLGMSPRWLRKTRVPVTNPHHVKGGPPWIRVGVRVRYDREMLDAWIEAKEVETAPKEKWGRMGPPEQRPKKEGALEKGTQPEVARTIPPPSFNPDDDD